MHLQLKHRIVQNYTFTLFCLSLFFSRFFIFNCIKLYIYYIFFACYSSFFSLFLKLCFSLSGGCYFDVTDGVVLQANSKETCYLLEGKVKVTPNRANESIESIEFGAGNLVVFPKGMSCTWDVSVAVNKHYLFE